MLGVVPRWDEADQQQSRADIEVLSNSDILLTMLSLRVLESTNGGSLDHVHVLP